MIKEEIQKLLDEHVNGDPKRFGEVWDCVPDLADRIRQFVLDQDSWIYLSPQSFDGWYLVSKNGRQELYYQEKGTNCWGTKYFENEKEAINELLKVTTDLEF